MIRPAVTCIKTAFACSVVANALYLLPPAFFSNATPSPCTAPSATGTILVSCQLTSVEVASGKLATTALVLTSCADEVESNASAIHPVHGWHRNDARKTSRCTAY